MTWVVRDARAMRHIPGAPKPKKKSPTETAVPLLLSQIAAMRLPTPVTEYQFHHTRKWRFDVAFPDYRLAVEVDGGGFVQGRHSRGLGMEDDATKAAEALLLGWRIFRTTPRQVKQGITANWLERAFLVLPKQHNPHQGLELLFLEGR